MATDTKLVMGFRPVDVSGIMADKIKTVQDIKTGSQRIKNNNILNESGELDIQVKKLGMLQKVAQGVKTINDMPKAIKFTSLVAPELSQKLMEQFNQDPQGTFAATQGFAGQDLTTAIQEYKLKNEQLKYENNLNGNKAVDINLGNDGQPTQPFNNSAGLEPIGGQEPIIQNNNGDMPPQFTYKQLGKKIYKVDANGQMYPVDKNSPQEKAYLDEQKSKNKKLEGKSKVFSALQEAESQTKIINDTIDEALNLISPISAGYGNFLSALPNSDARALENALTTIKSNVGFDKLQSMRDNSPTGGALGQVSDFENKLLQAVKGSLDPKQQNQLQANLKVIKEYYPKVLAEKRKAFQLDFGDAATPMLDGVIPVTVDGIDGFKNLPQGGGNLKDLSDEELLKLF